MVKIKREGRPNLVVSGIPGDKAGEAVKNILDLRGLMHRSDVRRLFAESMYLPSPDKLDHWIHTLSTERNVLVYGYLEKDLLIGILAVEKTQSHDNAPEMEILAIAVDPAFRGLGIGRELVKAVISLHKPVRLVAETDRDAVVFYHRCGFQVKNIGEKYPGVVRFRCEWTCSDEMLS